MPGVGLVSSGTAADAVDAAVRCASLRWWWRRRGVCQETFEDSYSSRRSPVQLRGCSVAVLEAVLQLPQAIRAVKSCKMANRSENSAGRWRCGCGCGAGAGAAAAAGFVLMLYRCVGLLEYLRCFNMSVDSKTPGGLGPYLAVAGRGALGRCIVVFFVFFVFSVAPVGAGDCLAVCVAVVSCLKLLKYLRERCGTERADSPVSVSVLRRCAHDLCVICV